MPWVIFSKKDIRMLTEAPVPGWDSKMVPHKRLLYPQSSDPNLPKLYFVAFFAGSRNSGKSYSCVKLIRGMEHSVYKDPKTGGKVPIRTILIAPTYHANPIYDSLHSLDPEDVHLEYSDSLLKEITDEIKQTRKDTKQYQKHIAVYKRFIKSKSLKGFSDDEIMMLAENDFEKPDECAYPNGVITNIVLDDLVGSRAYRAGKNPLIQSIILNRHMGVNFFILAQSVRSVPKTIRINCNLWVIFRFKSQKMINDDLYEEVSGSLTPGEFEELCKHAWETEHDALIMDFSQPTAKRYKKNLDKFLLFDSKQ